MTSIKPAENIRKYSPAISRVTSIVRFNSARVTPENNENSSEKKLNEQSSPPLSPSPFNLQIDEGLFQFNELSLQSPLIKNKIHTTTLNTPSRDENEGKERTVKVSEYCTPESTPFESLTGNISPKKLHRYILLTPRTIFSISLFTILSLGVVLIGFGIAISHRRAQLDYQCPVITYCPKDTSYTLICNITNEYCNCYNTEDEVIGCMRQRQYGAGCYRSQECSINHNLQCNLSLYQCQCLDHYTYNGSACIPMLTYGDICSILNDTCDYSLNLTCLTGNICICNTNITFWNGEYCESYRSVNSPCDPYKIPSGCSMTFICDNSTVTCQCSSSTYFDGDVCLSYSSYLEPCYDTSSCLPNTYLSCSEGLCQCDDSFFYWSSINSTCIYPKQIQYNSTCEYQTACESDFGLRCINGQCLCELNSYWTPGNYCDFQSQYNEQCLTAPCLANTGLICTSNTSICTCPQYYYWDNYVCQYQRTYASFCLNDNWCREDIGLRCRSYTCTCSLCTTCFWDGIRCRDCPTSWQIVVSNGTIQPRTYCYLKVDSYVNWNESLSNCAKLTTSYFGGTSHLIYIDDLQELQDVCTFATTAYYDIFIGYTNRFNYSQWFFANDTLAPPIRWCTGVATTFTSLTCTRVLISSVCVTDITCYGWTSRYICELD
ncbi:unnamed protein product [Adineta steineri]|uniref:C-type lectin domain-containing protein n=1 Tax=Adineta steineri TaxID=433720 RepID=A0A814AFS4_9BILA|nr:unnamed protein product [Adineta steineri]CAF3783359.1 unnamed protein product [Adineta steineri]